MPPTDPSSAPAASVRSTVTADDDAKRHAPPEPSTVGCCGGPAPVGVDACCVRDAEVKASGGIGCGCRGVGHGPAARR